MGTGLILWGPVVLTLAAIVASGVSVVAAQTTETDSNRSQAAVVAAIANGEGASEATLAAAENALAAGVALGRQTAARAEQLYGRVLLERGQWPEARRHLERSVALFRETGPDDMPALAEALCDLVGAALRSRDSDTVQSGIDELAARSDSLAPGLQARLLTLKARREMERGEYALGLDLARSAERLFASASVAPALRIEAMNLVGELEWFTDDLSASREQHAAALAISRDNLGQSHPITAGTMGDLAITEFDLGNADDALQLEVAALDLTRRARGEDHPDTLERMQDLASFSVVLADYPRAKELYDRALAATERVHGTQSDEAANLRYNLGVLEFRTGRLDAARVDAGAALKIWERTRGSNHPYLARPLDLLAAVERDAGDTSAAVAALQRAVSIREAGDSPLDLAWSLAELAGGEWRSGAVAAAEQALARARTLGEAAASTAKGYGAAIVALADSESTFGRHDDAARHYRAAASAYAARFGANHPAAASASARLAASLVRVGRPDEAFEPAREAAASWRAHITRTVRYLSEGPALDLARRPPEGRDVLLSLASIPGAAEPVVRSAFDAVVASRAMVLDEMASRRRAEGPQALELDRSRRRLASLLYRQAVQASDARTAAITAAENEVERLEGLLASETASGRAKGVTPDVESLAAHLPPKSVLVSFVRYRAADSRSLDGEEYLAFTLTTGGELRVRVLGSARSVDEAIARWRESVQDVGAALQDPKVSEEASRRAGRDLARLVWQPVAHDLKGADLALIVPDGSLFFVAFPALVGSHGAYLAEGRPALHQLSTERDLMKTRGAQQAPSLLVAGGPAYDAPTTASPAPFGALARGQPRTTDVPPCVDRLPTFEFLPAAAAEAREVGETWRRYMRDAPAHVLLGRSATKAEFERLAPTSTVLHLATHGFFIGPRCRDHLISAAAAHPAAAWAANPLLSAGLAMAGANQGWTAPEDEDNGLLTADEVAHMDLRRAEWVVLSACGTGLGRTQSGEGVLGLQRAFSLAGARTVIMSLWSVEDEQARAFVDHVYRLHLSRRVGAADAVRAAQLAVVRNLRKHYGAAPPALWAPFASTGDWR